MTDNEFHEKMSGMAKGDKNSLKDVYEEYVKLIFSIIYDTIKSKEEAEDITSEFFIKLYNMAGNYKPGIGHKRYLITVAKNMTIDRIRKLDREILTEEMPETPSEDGKLENQVVLSMSMQQAIETLKSEEKEILDLKVIGGFGFREISEMTGKPQGTVSWLYNNAIKKLRRCTVWD